ncbi:hypothetical protein PNOK_0152000 [Pyrrhoderma noxium]|uniref:DUF6534 domain-containing protein n=1 Tax=Pyrrhoderma noxium TaxID=2282107 RepID=A0A286UPP1_9AGAM|nr:hypothetical protein PNOK_0152000 [Pyrrhoderma noxium]
MIIVNTTPTLCAHIIVTQISDFVIRLFFARRVWYLSRQNKILTSVTIVLSIVIIVSGLWIGTVTFTYTNLLQFTDNRLTILMVYIINTGLLTSLCTAACFLTFALMPVNYIFIGINFSLSKLYFNSLLATLNRRERREASTIHTYGLQWENTFNKSSKTTKLENSIVKPESDIYGISELSYRSLCPSISIRVDTVRNLDSDAGRGTQPKCNILPLR